MKCAGSNTDYLSTVKFPHTNLQVVNFQRYECACVSESTSGIYCYVCATSTSGCTFVYFTEQYCME